MIPPRPWSVSEPPYSPGVAFVLDAEGKAAIPTSLPPELAHFLVARVNGGEAPR